MPIIFKAYLLAWKERIELNGTLKNMSNTYAKSKICAFSSPDAFQTKSKFVLLSADETVCVLKDF